MKNFVKSICFIVTGALLIGCLVCLIPDQYGEAYQRALVYQYDYYNSLGENKLVFVGNSSLSFGFDLDRMEELTGRPCAILGNHAGYGGSFVVEMSKSNLREGDIVVVELAGHSLSSCGSALLLTGIGKRFDMYRYFIPGVRGQVLAYYPTYIKENLNYWLSGGYHASGSYSMESYDDRGNMVFDRPGCAIPEPYTDEVAATYGWASLDAFEPDPAFCEYLNDYVAYCEERGVRVYFTVVCYLDEAVVSTKEGWDLYDESWRSRLDAPYISRTKDYIFPREYIYNAIAHCSEAGARYRTELLYRDLLPYLGEKKGTDNSN